MTESAGRVAWIAIAPVKSMALVFLDRADLGLDGIPGDRAFAVLDELGRLVNEKRAGTLATVRSITIGKRACSRCGCRIAPGNTLREY